MQDVKADWLKRVLGIDLSVAPSPAFGLAALHQTLSEDLAMLRAQDAALAKPIDAMVARAKTVARQNPKAAMAFLLAAAAAVAAAAGRRRAAEARASVEPGHVGRMVGLLDEATGAWRAGCAQARGAAAAHIAAVARRFPAQATGFGTILASYRADLEALLTAARGAATRDERSVQLAPINQMITALREEMSQDKLLAHLAANGIPVRTSLLTAIQRVDDILRAS